jgi:hypothetical protein
MRVPEEPVCIRLFRQNPVFTSLHLKSPVHVVPPLLVRITVCIESFLSIGWRTFISVFRTRIHELEAWIRGSGSGSTPK